MVTLIQVPAYVGGMLTRVPKHKRSISVMKWLKAHGESVIEGEAIVVLNTVKVAVEMASEASGLLFHLREVDEIVQVRDILGVVADSVEEFQEYRQQSSSEVA